jgi:hypothetical protein
MGRLWISDRAERRTAALYQTVKKPGETALQRPISRPDHPQERAQGSRQGLGIDFNGIARAQNACVTASNG